MKFLDKVKARWLAAPEWQRRGVFALAGFLIGLVAAP